MSLMYILAAKLGSVLSEKFCRKIELPGSVPSLVTLVNLFNKYLIAYEI